MTTKHTPGPWTLAGAFNSTRVVVVRALDPQSVEYCLALNGGAGHVADVLLPHAGINEPDNPSESMANARLIAAAPELLAAAEAVLRVAESPRPKSQATACAAFLETREPF